MSMYEKNTKQVNRMIARIFAASSVIIVVLVICSVTGVFEFGKKYTMIILFAGLMITISPNILIRFLPDDVMKYYMLAVLAVFIGVLGTNNHIGIYMSYALVPIFSGLYFEPKLVRRTGIFSYLVMAVAVFINSAGKYEVLYMGRDRITIYIAYMLGFTMEYLVVNSVLYMLVSRAKKMMEERYSAEEANRMKSRFLSSMSHEIRTPMNAIIGMTDVALRKDMSDDLRKNIEIIKSSSSGLLEIINDILDWSKIEAGKLNVIVETYKTSVMAEDMKSIIDARNVDKKVPIYYHISENMPEALEGDVVRIKQVMLNYASNAIKYTESGRIDITLNCENFEKGWVKLYFEVKDTGQGIRPEDMDKLFMMYSQLDARKNHGKEGAGIGLAISKYFVDAMNGSVSAESTYGEGSTFSFTVLQKIAEEGTEPAAEKAESAADNTDSGFFVTKNARALLVDDNELNREVLKAIIEPLKLEIEEAENGLEAVNKVRENSYDIIFMDSHMPVMNGEEATRAIRGLTDDGKRNIPIIAITADAVAGVKERMLESGMNDYVVKPINAKILCRIVRKYLPEEKIE